jgi:hypothetical protein
MFDQNNGTNDQTFGYADYTYPAPVDGIPLADEQGLGGDAGTTVTLEGTINRSTE